MDDSERERTKAEWRETLRRLADFKPRAVGFEVPTARDRERAKAATEQRRAPAMVYKTREAAPVTPAAPTPAPADSGDPSILEVLAEVVELCARQQGEIDSLREKLDAFTRTPDALVQSVREVRSSLADVGSALDEVRATLTDVRERNEQRRSDVLDLPALPRRH